VASFLMASQRVALAPPGEVENFPPFIGIAIFRRTPILTLWVD
jgi:hypothetical protein